MIITPKPKRIVSEYMQHIKDTAPVTHEEALKKEAYYVVIKSDKPAHNLLLEYSRKKGGKLVAISEINAQEEILCGCRFRGKTSSGESCTNWIKELKPYYGQLKPVEWLLTPIYVTSYFKHK